MFDENGNLAAERFVSSLYELFQMGLTTETIQDNPALQQCPYKLRVWSAWVTLVSSGHLESARADEDLDYHQ